MSDPNVPKDDELVGTFMTARSLATCAGMPDGDALAIGARALYKRGQRDRMEELIQKLRAEARSRRERWNAKGAVDDQVLGGFSAIEEIAQVFERALSAERRADRLGCGQVIKRLGTLLRARPTARPVSGHRRANK